MNFDFSDDLKLLKDEARKFLDDKSSPEVVRRVLEGPDGYDKALVDGDGGDGLDRRLDPRGARRRRHGRARPMRARRGARPLARAGPVRLDACTSPPRP